MKLSCNPSTGVLFSLIGESKHQAAKWLQDPRGRRWYWRPEDATHACVAAILDCEIIEKGIVISEDLPQ